VDAFAYAARTSATYRAKVLIAGKFRRLSQQLTAVI